MFHVFGTHDKIERFTVIIWYCVVTIFVHSVGCLRELYFWGLLSDFRGLVYMPRCENGKHRNKKTGKCELHRKLKNKTIKVKHNYTMTTNLTEEYNEFVRQNPKLVSTWADMNFAVFMHKKYGLSTRKDDHRYTLTTYRNEVSSMNLQLTKILKKSGLYSCRVDFHWTHIFILIVDNENVTWYMMKDNEIASRSFAKNEFITKYKECYTQGILLSKYLELFQQLFGVDVSDSFSQLDITTNPALDFQYLEFEYSYKAI
jgi:hypothetical protein